MAERTIARFGDPAWHPQFFSLGASDNEFFVVSLDSRRMAFLIRRPGGWGRFKQFVVLDGEPQMPYDAVLGPSLVFSPDSRHVAYEAREGKKWLVIADGVEGERYDAVGGLVFGPHGGRTAYMAERKSFLRREQTVVVDRREQKSYDAVGKGSIVFSPDGHHVAFGARAGRSWTVNVNGQEGAPYPRVADIVFGPIGRQVAYIAGEGEKAFVVLEGKEGPQYAGIGSLVFSSDGSRFAYEARKDGKWAVVLDGKEGRAFDGIGELGFSPDGRQLAYVAGSGGKQFVVLDGKKDKAYDGVLKGGLTFSPDSSRLAYGAGSREKVFVVVDGQKQSPYEGVYGETIQFSPDSQRLSYVARSGDRELVVVDDKEGKHYTKIDASSLSFSSNSRHLAYVAGVGDEQVLVLDGEEQEPYEQVRSPVFSPNGESIVYAASRTEKVSFTERVGNVSSVSNERMFVVVDGKAGKTYDQIILDRGAKIIFDDDVRFHYLAANLGSLGEELRLPVLEGSHYLLAEESLG